MCLFLEKGGNQKTKRKSCNSQLVTFLTRSIENFSSISPHYLKICLICNAISFFLRGEQTVKLTVTKGGPLPFAWDILSPQTQYGSIPFTKYPEDIPDYVKQSFPEGYTWERIMNFEDGAVCTVSNDSRYIVEN